jgi:hypothetical protein
VKGGRVMKYKKYLGLSVDGAVLMDVVSYYDDSTGKSEMAFQTNKGYSINCELFVNKYL